MIAVAESDVLRDDGLDYARRLAADGVPVRLIDCSGMIHGFLRWTGEVRASHRMDRRHRHGSARGFRGARLKRAAADAMLKQGKNQSKA